MGLLFTNVYFEIQVFNKCATGDAMYSAKALIKNVGMLLNPVEQLLQIFFLIFSVLSHCLLVVV